MKNELKKYMNQLNDDDEKSIPMANSSTIYTNHFKKQLETSNLLYNI